MANITRSSEFLIDEKIDQYRQKIYSIIHDGRSVENVYRTSFRPNRNHHDYPHDRLEGSKSPKKNKNLTSFQWQPYFSSQKLFITTINSPVADGFEELKVRTASNSDNNNKAQKQSKNSVLGLKTKTHILSAPPLNSTFETSLPTYDWTNPVVASLSRPIASRSESDWLKSFEALQSKRNNFVNMSSPRFDKAIPLVPQAIVAAKQSLGTNLEPANLIRHYSIYMPDVEIDDDGRLSMKSRNCSPVELAETPVDTHPDDVEEERTPQFSDENDGTLTQHNLVSRRCQLRVNLSHYAAIQSFEFGHPSLHSLTHKASVQTVFCQRDSIPLRKDSITLRIVPTGLQSEPRSECPAVSPFSKRVIFSDQLESVKIIPGRQVQTKKKRNRRSPRKK